MRIEKRGQVFTGVGLLIDLYKFCGDDKPQKVKRLQIASHFLMPVTRAGLHCDWLMRRPSFLAPDWLLLRE